MNKIVRQHQKTVLRFVRWSRKSFSAFCSIGCCVTIGCLKCGIANTSMLKQEANFHSKIRSIDSSLTDVDNLSETDVSEQESRPISLGSSFLLLLPILCCQHQKKVCAAARIKQKLNINDIIKSVTLIATGPAHGTLTFAKQM